MLQLLRWFAVLSALAACTFLLIAPLYRFESETSATGGAGAIRTRGSGTLIAANGASVLVVLAIPTVVALSALAPWPKKYRRVADIIGAIIVVAFAILGSMTIGLFFVPTAVALVSIAIGGRSSQPAT